MMFKMLSKLEDVIMCAEYEDLEDDDDDFSDDGE